MKTNDLMPGAMYNLCVILVLDTSGSMKGEKIAQSKSAIREMQSYLRDGVDGVNVKLALITFGNDAKLVTNNSEFIDDFVLPELEAGGKTNVGKALELLAAKLNRSSDGFLYKTAGVNNCRPIIIFLSDGLATDDFRPSLDKLKANPWFSRTDASIKIAIAVGDEQGKTAHKATLAEIVGDENAVLTCESDSDIKRLIVASALKGSLASSRTVMSGAEDPSGADIVKSVKEDADIDIFRDDSGESFPVVPLDDGTEFLD